MMVFGFFMSAITDGQIKWLWFALALIVYVPILSVRLAYSLLYVYTFAQTYVCAECGCNTAMLI